MTSGAKFARIPLVKVSDVGQGGRWLTRSWTNCTLVKDYWYQSAMRKGWRGVSYSVSWELERMIADGSNWNKEG